MQHDDLRTFACPRCGEMLLTGATSCEYCAAPLTPDVAYALANERDQVRKSIDEARSLLRTAWLFLGFYALSHIPYVAPLGLVGTRGLLVWFLLTAVAWYQAYGSLPGELHADYSAARSQFHQALMVAGLPVVVEGVAGVWRLGG
jgi:hypothetical protein